MTAPTPTPVAQALEAVPEPPFPPAPVEELLRLLVKAGRAHQLYLPNNPMYKGAIEALRGGFAPIWQHTQELALRFTDIEIKWFGRAVLVEKSKSSDSLPWTFYKDGIREITLTPGFEEQELETFLGILQRLRKAAPDEDDLLTMLWEADFVNLRYRYVDLGAEPMESLRSGEPVQQVSPDQVRSTAHEQASEANAIVNIQDFDSTLYFLDEKELEYLRHEIDREYNSDLRGNVVSILFDIYEAQTAPAVREEISGLIETLMLMLLSAGQLRNVGQLLAETQIAAGRATQITPEQQNRLARLPDRLSAAEPLGQLLQALDESADLPPQAELNALFEQLRPTALGTILGWMPRLNNQKIRALVEQSADRLASANTAELVKLVLSPDRAVALEAMRRSGAVKTPAAVAPLARVLGNPDVELRLAAVQALTDIGSAGALQALERSVEDADRDVRVAAARTLGAKAYRGAFARVEAAVKGKAIREAVLTEKMAFFEAYGAMCGDAGVPFLDDILNSKGMFGRREDSEFRACAAMALGRVGTKKAQDALQRASAEKDVVVRNAVSRAMRGGTA